MKIATTIVLLAIGYWLSALLVAAPPSLAQSGCATTAAPPPFVASPALSPSGTIGLRHAASLGGNTNAVASLAGGQTMLFNRGADFGAFKPASSDFNQLHLDARVQKIAVGLNALYLATGSGGLQITNTDATQQLGLLRTPGLAAAIALDGPRAYLAAAGPGGGLHVVNVADPAHPQILSSTPTYASATAIAYAGGLAYVAEGLSGGIEIFDVTNPLSPTLRGSLITPGYAGGIALDGPRAYVAAGTCGLQVLNVADPATPSMLGAVATGGDAQAIQISAGRAYVAAGAAGLLRFNLISTLPTLVTQQNFGPLAPISDVFVDGPTATLAAGPSGAITVDISSDGSLPTIATAPTLGGVRAARVSGDNVYLALGDGGVAAVSTALTDTLILSRSITATPALNLAIGSAISGTTTIYAASGRAGLSVIQTAPTGILTTTGTLTATRTISLTGTIGAILVNGASAYAAAGDAGVHILRLTDPLSPTLQTTVDTPGAALALALDSDLLYVADFSGLRVINPLTGVIIGSYDTPVGTFVRGVVVFAGRAYLASSSGIITLDVTAPTQPTFLSRTDPFSAYDIALRGTQLIVAAGKDGVLAFDISGASGPRLTGIYDTPGTALGVTFDGDTILVSDNDGGLLRLTVIALPYQVWIPEVSR